MSLEQRFRTGVKSELEKLTDKLLPVLKKLIEHKYPPEVQLIDFEIFGDSFTSQFPINTFYLDKDNNEFFLYKNGKAQYPSVVDSRLLAIDGVYSDDFEDAFTDEDDDFDPWFHATEVLVAWFAEIWNQAGGQQLGLKVTIGGHGEKKFDLQNQTWID